MDQYYRLSAKKSSKNLNKIQVRFVKKNDFRGRERVVEKMLHLIGAFGCLGIPFGIKVTRVYRPKKSNNAGYCNRVLRK